MAVRRRGNSYSLRIRPFEEEIGISTPAKTKQEAKRIEMALMTACRSGDYRGLDPVSREICIRLFKNKGWSIPSGLGPEEPVAEELTLWKSVEIFLKYPEIRASSERPSVQSQY